MSGLLDPEVPGRHPGMPCPPTARWIALAGSGGTLEDREPLLGHAEACPACTQELAAALAATLPQPPLPPGLGARALATLPRRIPAWPLRAAAGALLALGAAWLWIRDPGVPTDSATATPPATQAPRNPFEVDGIDRVLPLGACGSVAVRAGAQVVIAGNEVRLDEGALEATASGLPIRVAWASGSLTLTRGVVRAETLPRTASAAALIREALAGEDGMSIRVVAGEAVLTAGGRTEHLVAGRAVRAAADGIAEEPALEPWAAPRWIAWPGLPALLRDGAMDLAVPTAAPYRWEAVIRRKSTDAAVAVRFPALGQGWEITLGEAYASRPGEPCRVAVACADGWIRLEAGGRILATRPVIELTGRADVSAAAAPGLRAWGGDVEILEARWR